MMRRIVGLMTACIMILTSFTGFTVTAFAQSASDTIAATSFTEEGSNTAYLNVIEDRVKEFKYLSEAEGGNLLKYTGIAFDGTENFVSFTFRTREDYKVGFKLYADSLDSDPIAVVKQYGSGWSTDTVMMGALNKTLNGEHTLWVEALPSESETDPEDRGTGYPMDFVNFSFSTASFYPAGETILAMNRASHGGNSNGGDVADNVIKTLYPGGWSSYLIEFAGTEESARLSVRSASGYTLTYSLYLDDLDTLLATGTMTTEKTWNEWETVSMDLNQKVSGKHIVYVKYEASTQAGETVSQESNLKDFIFKTPVSASSVIAAPSYAEAVNVSGGGIRVEENTFVKEFDPGDSLSYSDISFSGKETTFEAVFRTWGAVGINVYVDSVSEENLIASASEEFYNWGASVEEAGVMSGEMLQTVTGKHTLILVAQTNETSMPMDLISFTFKESEEQKDGIEHGTPVYEGGQATIAITGYNNIGASTIQVIFAVYDSDQKLIASNASQKVNTADMTYGVPQDFTATLNTAGGETVKAFIWDSLENMVPLAEMEGLVTEL